MARKYFVSGRLPEPVISDDTPGRRGELLLDWLARSTSLRAKECRRFLNENLAVLPIEAQLAIQQGLENRWLTALFELVVGRILQELGATITIEEANEGGKRPDFTARFLDGTVIVEAVAPIFDADAGETEKNRRPLLEIIEAHIPKGWYVGVRELPNISPNETKKYFKSVVARMLTIAPPENGAGQQLLTEELASGKISLHLWPARSTTPQLAVEPPLTVFDQSEARIREAVKRKKPQVRQSPAPVLLAIHASGIGSSFEEFDQALFGRTYSRYDEQFDLVETGFDPDGLFTHQRSESPTYAGVLAFVEVGFLAGPAPILYQHSRFAGVLPAGILQLEQRIYDRDAGEIRTEQATITDLVERLRFVQPRV
jgi:hypothetical protein